MYEKAMNYIDNNNYEKALSIVQQNLAKNDSLDVSIKILVYMNDKKPNDPKILEALGDVYSAMHINVAALDNYSAAEKLDSTNANLEFKMGRLMYLDGQFTDAANKYLKVISMDSTYSQAYYQLGILFYYAKDYGHAAYYLHKYLGFDQKNKTVYLNCAESYYKINDFKDALSVSEEGLKQSPNNLKLLKISADSKLATNDINGAMTAYNSLPDTALKISDLNRIARELNSAQQDSLAAIFINKSLTQDSTQLSIYQLAGDINLTAKNYAEAAKYYRKKLQVDSASVNTMTDLGLVYIELKQYPKAKQQFAKAIAQQNDFIPAYIWYARTERLTDSLNEGLKIYQKLIDVTKGKEDNYKNEVSESYAFLGYGDLLHKRYPSAIENLKSAVVYLPTSAQYHVWLGEAYALKGEKTRATEEYKNALKIQPDNPDAKKGLKLLAK